jgi:membrane associated rhomboid family serine protease
VSIGLLRRTVRRETANEIWNAAGRLSAARKRCCPFCSRRMSAVMKTPGGINTQFDVCRLCQLVWFDPDEYARLEPGQPEERKDPISELPIEAREAIALASLERLAQDRAADAWVSEVPESKWKFWVGMLGVPVENESGDINRYPMVTWSIGLAMVAVTLTAIAFGEHVFYDFGWVVAEPFRRGGLTLLTGNLLHAGWLHLLGNLYFLLVFGDNVEDRLGHARYAAMIAIAAVVGDVGHSLVAPDPTVPVVGASGGISGILACYAVLFPRYKLSLRFVFSWISMPAYALFGLWVLWQFFLARLQAAELINVSAAAHLGGALVGLLFGIMHRRYRA